MRSLAGCGPRQAENGRTTIQPAQGDEVSIPGTHVQVVPPEHFKIADNFQGLRHVGEEAAISVVDLAGDNFYVRAATLSPEGFAAKGFTVLDYRDTLVDNYPARYAYLSSEDDTRTHLLAFGDSTFSTTLTGIFPATDATVDTQIKDALFSSMYDKSAVIDPMATASFTVDESQSKFKFASYTGNMYTYAASGQALPTPDDKAFITLAAVPTQNETAADFAGTIMADFDKMGLRDRKVKNESRQRLNGYDAYEAEVYGTLQGVETMLYILYLVNDRNGVFMRGTATTNYAANLAEFKKFSHTLRFKE